MQYCVNCEKLVTPQKDLNWLAFFILLVISFWALGLFGWLYLIYYAFKKPTCPICNSTNWGVQPIETEKKY